MVCVHACPVSKSHGETYIGLATMVSVGPLSGQRLNSSRLCHAEIQKIECPMSVHDTSAVSQIYHHD